MPEYLVFGKEEMLQHLFVDVLARDIVVRYGLRNLAEIKALGLYLISNVGKEFSYNRLRASFGLGSTTTVISYISYLEDSYLFFSMPKQDYSFRRQMASPKKGYAIDNGLARVNSVSFSEDRGRALENAVFLELRRENRGLYYYKNLGECDFLVGSKGKIVQAIQVCARLTKDNQNRELGGLRAAMKEFGLKMGLVITEEQEDSLGNIMVVPAWKWMGEQKVYNP